MDSIQMLTIVMCMLMLLFYLVGKFCLHDSDKEEPHRNEAVNTPSSNQILPSNLPPTLRHRKGCSINTDEKHEEATSPYEECDLEDSSIRILMSISKSKAKKEAKIVESLVLERYPGEKVSIRHQYEPNDIIFHLKCPRSLLTALVELIRTQKTRFSEASQLDAVWNEIKEMKRHYLEQKEELSNTQEELSNTREELSNTRKALSDTQENLLNTREELLNTKKQLREERTEREALEKRFQEETVERKNQDGTHKDLKRALDDFVQSQGAFAHQLFLTRSGSRYDAWADTFGSHSFAGMTDRTAETQRKFRREVSKYYGSSSCVITQTTAKQRPADWPVYEETNEWKFPWVKCAHLWPRSKEEEAHRQYPKGMYESDFEIDSCRNGLFMRFDCEFAFDRRHVAVVKKLDGFHFVCVSKTSQKKTEEELRQYLLRNQHENHLSEEEIEKIVGYVNLPLDVVLGQLDEVYPYMRVLLDHSMSSVLACEDHVSPNLVGEFRVVYEMNYARSIASEDAQL